MAQRKRFKVTLPSGETVWLAGETVSEAFISGLQKYDNRTRNHSHISRFLLCNKPFRSGQRPLHTRSVKIHMFTVEKEKYSLLAYCAIA